MNSFMTFGKYRGTERAVLIERDPRYMLWAHRNVDGFKLTDAELRACRFAIRRFATRRRYRHGGGLCGIGSYADFGNN